MGRTPPGRSWSEAALWASARGARGLPSVARPVSPVGRAASVVAAGGGRRLRLGCRDGSARRRRAAFSGPDPALDGCRRARVERRLAAAGHRLPCAAPCRLLHHVTPAPHRPRRQPLRPRHGGRTPAPLPARRRRRGIDPGETLARGCWAGDSDLRFPQPDRGRGPRRPDAGLGAAPGLPRRPALGGPRAHPARYRAGRVGPRLARPSGPQEHPGGKLVRPVLGPRRRLDGGQPDGRRPHDSRGRRRQLHLCLLPFPAETSSAPRPAPGANGRLTSGGPTATPCRS